MANYESDSSDGGDGGGDGGGADSFVTTNVLLGYASKEAADDDISQLGGVPSWLHSTPPPPHHTVCRVCCERMPLILQLHADLPDRFPGHERRLHVFGCRRKACRRKDGSVRVLRSTWVDEGVAAAATKATAAKAFASGSDSPAASSTATATTAGRAKPNLGSAIFGGGGKGGETGTAESVRNPFALGGGGGGGSGSSSAAGPTTPFAAAGSPASLASKPAPKKPNVSTGGSALAATFAEKASLGAAASASPNQPTAKPQSPLSSSVFPDAAVADRLARATLGPQQPPYPSFFLDADYEALGEGPPDAGAAREARVQLLDMEVDGDGDGDGSKGKSGGGGGSGKDSSGDFESAHDRAFQRFADRLWHNPEQVLRYEWGGAPLLYSRADAVGRALQAAAASGGASGEAGGASKVKVKTEASIGSSSGDGGGGGGGTRGIPACAACGCPRAYECQVTPHAIIELEGDGIADRSIDDGMEWGTIIVGACTRDCADKAGDGGDGGDAGDGGDGGNSGRDGNSCRDGNGVVYREEWAGVQWEESRR